MEWMLIETLQDDEKIFTGAGIRIYNTAKSFEEQCDLPCGKENYLDYVITDIYDNCEYFQLTCLTEGEVGNVTSVFKRDNGNLFITGKEIKRMLQTDLYKVFIHTYPKIVIS